MVSVSLKAVVGRLNSTCHRALEAAAGICLSRTNYNVEVEHWLLKLVETAGTDLAPIFKRFEVDGDRVQRDLTRAIDKLKTGNARTPVLSPDTVDWARDAWLIGSVEFGAPRTRSAHLLCSLLLEESRAMLARSALPELGKISVEALMKELPSIVANSPEQEGPATLQAGAGPALPAGKAGATAALDQYTVDLTLRAREGKIDPVLGRDAEVRQMIDILMRRRQNNPILTGEAGVGKTAVVEGLAQRIVAGDVPPPLRDVALRSLDLGLLQAGASIRGEFENRLRGVIDEVKASPKPIIVFIDEAHMLIGAGGQAGQGDAANLLKPALARGELRSIAATTWAEYKKYFEKDPALSRRFQVVKVEEPDEDVAVQMMRGLVDTLETHHRVRVLEEAVVESVRLSKRYITGRQLPDKSVSLLDTACARVAIGLNDVPPAVEDLRRRIGQLGVQIEALHREQAVGAEHREHIDRLGQQRAESEKELEALEQRWKQEADLARAVIQARIQLETGRALPVPGAKVDGKPVEPPKLTEQELAEVRQRYEQHTRQLRELQGDDPLVLPCVDKHTIAQVVAAWTGIPVGRMVADEIQTVLRLKEALEQRIVGQSHALDAIAQSIRSSRADLTDPGKPIAVFFMPGPSGVGKTETALALAELLYGGEQNVNTINMSEFKEEHKVSLLMGSPPGYVGYGEGGVLTEAVRRRPYSVVLLDEMEKAHPGVQDIFYQVFDKGTLRDGEGRDINFKNTVIIMTSNAASDAIMKLCADPTLRPEAMGLTKAIYPELLKTFKPAFLGRTTIVPYFPLTDEVLRKIITLKLNKIVRRVKANYNATLSFSPQCIDTIASRCTEVETGARNVDVIVARTLLPELSGEVLARMVDGRPFAAVAVGVTSDGRFSYQVD